MVLHAQWREEGWKSLLMHMVRWEAAESYNPEVEDPGTLRVSANPQSLGEPCGDTRRDKRREGSNVKEISQNALHGLRTLLGHCPVQTVS